MSVDKVIMLSPMGFKKGINFIKKENIMEGIANIIRPTGISVSPWLLTALAVTAFSMVIIFYGVDPIAKVAHDTFHDFRHVIGMPCH